MPSKISIQCIRGSGDQVSPPISDSMITTENMAIKRGKRYLDDPSQGGYYVVFKRTIKTVHKSNEVLPTTWVALTDSHLGLSAVRMKVKEYSIEISPNSVWATMSLEEYKER